MTKPLVKQIMDALGDDVIAEKCKVGHHSTRNARTTGRMPASWFPVVRDLCKEIDQECPESAFNFKSPISDRSVAKKVVTHKRKLQPRAAQ